MSANEEVSRDVELNDLGEQLLASFREAIRKGSSLPNWTCRFIVVNAVSHSAQRAANRLTIAADVEVNSRLKAFATEVRQLYSLSRLLPLGRFLVHLLPHTAIPLIVASTNIALLTAIGKLITPFPGIYGLVSGALYLIFITVGATGKAWFAAAAYVHDALALIEKTVDEPEKRLFSALKERSPRRVLPYALPIAWAFLWLATLGAVTAGFILAWQNGGPPLNPDYWIDGGSIHGSPSSP